MELESSLPHVQEPSTGPCPELDESNSHPHNLSKVNVNVIITSILGLQSVTSFLVK